MFQLRKSDFGRKAGKRTHIKPVPKQESSSAQWRNTMTDKEAKILNTWKHKADNLDTAWVLTKKFALIKPLHFRFPAKVNDSLLHFHYTNTYPLTLRAVLQCSWSYQEEGNSLAITVLWPSICQKDALRPSRCKGVNLSTLMVPESCDREVPWNTRYSGREMEMIIRRSIYARRRQNDRVRGQSSSISPGIKDWHAESEKAPH